jgi:tRNA A37 N6-isopentenylltransferase MiaA
VPALVCGLEVPAAVLERRLRRRTEEMYERGVEAEVAAAGTVVPEVLGLEAVRKLPRAEAVEEIVHASRRLAAYQRKWMRRIPGIVTIDADRAPEEVADAVLEMARARQ